MLLVYCNKKIPVPLLYPLHPDTDQHSSEKAHDKITRRGRLISDGLCQLKSLWTEVQTYVLWLPHDGWLNTG